LIIKGLEEGIAHNRGEKQLRTRTVQAPAAMSIQAIRTKLGISQSDFAVRYGRSAPDSAVRAYLTVIDRNPQAVADALSSTILNPEPPALIS
jgi:putative transcriptional regulator